MKKLIRGLAIAVALFAGTAHATTDWSAQEYDLYSGDFDKDGYSDILYVAKDPAKPSGIARSSGGAANVPWQSWPSNFLGIPWSRNQYNIVVADFNGDQRADILMQSVVPGDSYVLLTSSTGKVVGISQTINNSNLGLTWSADQHRIVSADFSGDGRKDLFLQATSPSGLNAVVTAGSSGTFTTGPAQSWNDGYMGFKWSTANAIVFAGNFNSDAYGDLLIQAKPKWVTIDYEVPFPVPTYPPNMNGIAWGLYGGFSPSAMTAWSRNYNGIDWSPLTSTLVVGDFNGDNITDIVAQGRYVGRSSYLLAGGYYGPNGSAPTTLSANVPITRDSAQLLAGNFGSAGRFYVQTLTPGGTNYTGSLSNGTLTVTTHDPSPATTTSVPTAVGRTVGSFAVSNSGSATYTVPIVVPSGVSGVQPQLAISYQSGGGNGLLGVGWGLSGFSEIERCRKTLAQDNTNAGVTMTGSDVFCLEGNRLRLTGGNYGATGSTYQTEMETYSRITIMGQAGSGPSWFKVEAKDGLTYEYGNSADSFIESMASGFTTTARVWALTRVYDRYGNTMNIVYCEDSLANCPGAVTTNGSFRPWYVAYTANTTAGIVAAYQVNFVWETRPSDDTLTQYFGGGLIQETRRLKRVETYWNDPAVGNWRVVRKYQFGYNQSGTSPRSRLTSIQECDTNGACLSPTTVSWQDGSDRVEADNGNSPSFGFGAPYLLPMDMEGDGRTDLVYPVLSTSAFAASTCTWNVAIASTSGTFTGGSGAGGGTIANCDAALPIDINSDGRSDLLVKIGSSGNYVWHVLRSGGATFTPVSMGIAAPAGANKAWVVDFDGDGRQDVVTLGSDNVTLTLLRNTGGSLLTFASSVPLAANSAFNTVASQGFIPATKSAVQALDANADGRTDLLVSYRDRGTPSGSFGGYNWTYNVGVLYSTGSGFSSPVVIASAYNNSSAIDTVFNGARAGDFNGDGQADLIYPCANNTSVWCVRLGTGVGIGAESVTSLPVGPDLDSVVVFDWNGDGRADVMEPGGAGSTWQILAGTGNAPPAATLALPAVVMDVNGVGVSTSGALAPRLIDSNGDGLADLAYVDTSGALHYRRHTGPLGDLVQSIADGFGNSVAINYSVLTDSSVYQKGTEASYPEMDLKAALPVVKSFVSTNGIADPGSAAGQYTVTQSYTGARVHLGGRGYEGFLTRTESDGRTGVNTTTTFNQLFPRTGTVSSAVTKQSNGTIIEDASSTYQYAQTGTTQWQERYFVYASSTTQNGFEVGGTYNGSAIKRVTTSTTINTTSGSPTGVTAYTYDMTSGSAVLAQTTFTNSSPASYPMLNDTTNWCLGFVQQQEVTRTPASQSGLTRTTRLIKDAANPGKCRVSQKIVEPGHATLALTTTYGYDNAGHVTSEAVSGPNIVTRTTATSYGTQGVFPVSVTNAESESASKTYDYGLGVPKTSTDVNGLVVSWGYDGFGRKTLETRPDGTKTSWTLYSCTVSNGNCGDPLLRYQVQEQQLDAGNGLIRYSVQMYDAPARVKYSMVQTMTGQVSTVHTIYDNQGRVSQKSMPYFSGGGAWYTTTSYDLIGRPTAEWRQISQSNTGTRTLSYAYERLVNKLTDANNKITTKQTNAIGQVVSVADPASGVTQYQYDQFWNLKTTTDPVGNQIVNNFNIRGFKDSMSDPDMGAWTYTYYPTGELWTQTDAKAQVATFTYDKVGRKKTRVEPEGTTTWIYGTSQASKNVGQLTTVTSPGSYQEDYQYDSLGRPNQVTTTPGSGSYVVNSTYSSTGLLDTVTYPTSTAAVTNSRFKVQYAYAYGQLQAVKDGYNSSILYWQANSTDAAGHTTSEMYGNAVTTTSSYDALDGLLRSRQAGASNGVQNESYDWDSMGNLGRRQDVATNLTELFYYDNLYRLDYSTLNGVQNLDLSYDAIGNILTKTGLSGSYNYNTAQSGCSYTGLTAQPHAVRNAGGTVYCYDKNGNMTKRGADTQVWTSYNLPSQLVKGSSTSTLSYGAARNRFKQVTVTPTGQNMPAGTETTIYVGGLYEKVTKPSGVIEYKHSIMAGGEAIAIKTLRSNSADDVRYLHKDHLGSVATITNESGVVVTRLSFDAFGQRRDAGTWAGTPGTSTWTAIAGVTHRGFTYHEHLDNVDLVHMNGRVYDPTIGRFLSADPIIQEPLMSQSLNRFSYVMNNPLSLIDPTGFSWLSKMFKSIGRFFKKWGSAIIGIALSFVPGLQWYAAAFISSAYNSAVNGGNFLKSFGLGLITGGIGGGIAGGLIKGAGFWTQVARGALAGGIAGGLTSSYYGGSFWDGFGQGALVGGVVAGVAYGIQNLVESRHRAAARMSGNNANEMTSAERQRANQDAINRFQKDNPDITVNFQNDYDTWAVGVGGDVRTFDSYVDAKNYMDLVVARGGNASFVSASVKHWTAGTVRVYASFAVEYAFPGNHIFGWVPTGDFKQAILWHEVGHASTRYGGGGLPGYGGIFSGCGTCESAATEWAKQHYR